MTTYYSNINNAYVAIGDGSLESPFNYLQLSTQLALSSPGDIFLLSGKNTDSASGSVFLSAPLGVTIDAADETDPWRLKLITPGVEFSTGHGITKNGIIESVGQITLDAGAVYNLYAKSTADIDSAINVGGVLSLKGCTLSAPVGTPNSIYIGVNTETSGQLINCVLSGKLSYYVDVDADLAFNNCAFEGVSGPTDAEDYDGITALFAGCQFSWTPAVSLPGVDAPSTSFLEQTVAPDGGINDLTVSSSNSFSGYEKGLFGGDDRNLSHGIGAFKFVDVEVVVSPPEEEEEEEIRVKPRPENLPVIACKLEFYEEGPNGGFKPRAVNPSQSAPTYISPLPTPHTQVRPIVRGPNGGFRDA